MDFSSLPAYQPKPQDKAREETLFGTIHKRAQKNQYMTMDDFLEVVRWKSPRAIRSAEKNSPDIVEKITKMAFELKDEEGKIKILTTLDGVSIPMASSILTVWSPKEYGVIDIRAWYSLYKMELVPVNKSTFGIADWIKYLGIIREKAKEAKCTSREIDAKLYQYFETIREGKNVYRKK
jgi:hypothetical protein